MAGNQFGTSSSRYDCYKTTNPNYLVSIRCAGEGLEINCDMPEEQTNAVGSEWEAMLPSAISEIVSSSAIVRGAAAVIGTNGVFQDATTQIWVNSSPVSIPLTLLFDAKSDALKQVYEPMRRLEMLAMPSIGIERVGLLTSPGPNRASWFGKDLSLQVHIGRHVYIKDAIIKSVSSSYASKLDDRGYPISGKLDLEIMTSKVLSSQDWAQFTGIS